MSVSGTLQSPTPTSATPGPPLRVGLIAGQGQLPFLVAEGIQRAGFRVCGLGLAGQFDPDLPAQCDQFQSVGITQLGRWIRILRRWEVSDAIMVGRVAHSRKHGRFLWLRYPPDLLALRLWYSTLRHDRRTATMLTVLADALGRRGVNLLDCRVYLGDQMAIDGVLTTRTPPTADVERDLAFGWPLLMLVADHGIGQAIAVRGCDVLAVEAAEGTDALIDRAGPLARGRPWMLLKSSSATHDMRADVATIGVTTIERLHAAGGRTLVVGADHVIMIDREAVIRRAEELNICIIGVALNTAAPLPPRLAGLGAIQH